MQRVIETMGKGEGVRRSCRGKLRQNKSSFPDCGSKEPLRGYPHYLDEKILPPGNNNDNTPLSFVCLEPGLQRNSLTMWDSLKSRSCAQPLMGSKSRADRSSARFRENAEQVQRR